MNLDDLDPDQRRAVLADPLPTVVMAGAGSGKTRVLTFRIANQLAEGIADPSEVMASTFTKAAAGEMRDRISLLLDGAPAPSIATFHSLMFRLLREEASLRGGRRLDVCKESERTRILAGLLGPPSREYPTTLNIDADVKDVGAWISQCKNVLVHSYDDFVNLTVDECGPELVRGAAARIYPLYEAKLAELGKLDFDDMILHAYDLLAGDTEVLRRAQRRWTAFFVDECQPTGTTVRTPSGLVKIEDLRVGDRVTSYEQSNQQFLKRGSRVLGISKRHFDGDLIAVTAAGVTTRYTPNHRCIAQIGPAIFGKTCLYLMCKGDSWRVGIASAKHGTSGTNVAGPVSRMREERAEAVWVLDVFDDRRDAILAESATSARYGIPMQRFVDGGHHSVGQPRLDTFWSSLGDLSGAAAQCLSSFGRDIRYPLVAAAGAGEKQPHLLMTRRATIHACNLLTGMKILEAEPVLARPKPKVTKLDSAWQPISVSREPYVGDVWSMTVERAHTYIGDGFLTHNCQDTNAGQWAVLNLLAAAENAPNLTVVGDTKQALYGFRGAQPDLMEKFDRMYPGARRYDLVTNYRSTPQVIRAANQVIAVHGHPAQVPAREAGVAVRAAAFSDPLEQAAEIARFVEAMRATGRPGSDCAILVRTNGQTAQIERAMVAAKLPYSAGGGGFLNRLEVADMLAYLRLARDDTDEAALRRIINRPTRYLGAAFVDAVVAQATVNGRVGDDSLVEAMAMVDTYKGKKMTGRQRAEAAKLSADIDAIRGLPPMMAIRQVLEVTGYMKWLRKNDGSEDSTDESTSENLEALMEMAVDFSTIDELLDYATEADRLLQESGDATEICTVHRSKGREWPYVVVSNFYDDSFPHRHASDVDEERRIAYVAMTRARDALLLTVPDEDSFDRKVDPSPYLATAGVQWSTNTKVWWGDALTPRVDRSEMLSLYRDLSAS